jgi:galactokinase
MAPARGFDGTVATTLPIGAGLSSSAALEIAVALALGFEGTAASLAELCQRAEQRASGVPCGIMDQLTIAAAVEHHAVMIDCHDLSVRPIALPDDVDIVVQFVAHRTLVGSPYADRVRECATAEADIGPLRLADESLAHQVTDPVARRRALHVVNENQRVRDFVEALATHDLEHAGALMVQSHDSLRDFYDTSTPTMDRAVRELMEQPGVFGVRMTGGGFGGCVVALCRRGALTDGWLVRPVGAATVTVA